MILKLGLLAYFITVLLSLFITHLGVLKCKRVYGSSPITRDSTAYLGLMVVMCMIPVANIFWSCEFCINATDHIKADR